MLAGTQDMHLLYPEFLTTLIDDRATIHDMADTSKLDARAREDLVTYLESL